MNKAQKLRELFNKEGVIRIVGAHDGLSAKLVEFNDFDGVWASGFEISASHAVPDANILTMTQYLEAASTRLRYRLRKLKQCNAYGEEIRSKWYCCGYNRR